MSEVATVSFVGAGPGDPELITVKGLRLLREADYVLYTGSLVPREIVASLAAEVEDSKGLDLDQVVERLVRHARAGRRVVRLHTGDPSIFGAVQEQRARLHAAGVPTAVVPGVTSALAAAAAIGAELTLPGLAQTVVIGRTAGRTPVPEGERLADLARLGNATLCLYLSASLTDKVARELVAGGRSPETPVAVVQYASMPDRERVIRCTLGTLAEAVRAAGVRAQAVILVGPAVDPAHATAPGRFDSRLYARDFSHRFRRGDPEGASTPRSPRGDRFDDGATLRPASHEVPER